MISLSLKKNKAFYTMMLAIMLPIALQNLISSSLNLVDNVMIGQLGETEIASVGLANQVFFLLSLILFGANSGASIFVAQYWGKRDLTNIKSVLSIALWFSLGISFLFFVVSFLKPEYLIELLSKDPEVIRLGAIYLKIVSISFVITALSFSFGFSSRSIGRPKLPMYSSAISLGINTFLNYILIFGHFGFDAYGVKGAAIATLIARCVELLIILYGIYRFSPELALMPKDLFNVPKAVLTRVFKKTWPVILNETFWALGMTTYALIYARIGTDAAAAVMISNTVNSLFMVLCFGLGNASAIMIGNILGENNISKAIEYNKKFLVLGLMGGALIGGMVYTLSPFLVDHLYNLSPNAYTNTINTLKVMALFMPFRFYNTILIIGTLRSGGDTLYSLLLEIGCVWTIGVPLAIVGAFVWQLPVYYVVALVAVEEVAKMLLGLPRIISNKWAKNIVS